MSSLLSASTNDLKADAPVPSDNLASILASLESIQKSFDLVLQRLDELDDECEECASDVPVGVNPVPSRFSNSSSVFGSKLSSTNGQIPYSRPFPYSRARTDFGPNPSFGPMAFPRKNPYFQ